MNKLYPIENCINCPAWSYEMYNNFCELKNKIIPDYAHRLPKLRTLENEKKFSFFKRLFR